MWWSGLGFIIGMVLGSFIKAISDRSLTDRSFFGRSYCEKCKHTLAWYDLFPLLSYLTLGGKCRYCKKKIGKEYLAIETLSGILFAFLFWHHFQTLPGINDPYNLSVFIFELIFKTFFVLVLSILTLTDIKEMLIPDRIVIPAIAITTLSLILITIYKVSFLYYFLANDSLGKYMLPPHGDYFQRHAYILSEPLLGSIVCGVLIGAFFLSLVVITRGRGMGGGDIKLGAFIGVGLGFPYSIFAIMLSFITGAIFSIALILLGKKRFGQTIPFGPFLVLGSLILLFWGDAILKLYLGS